MLSPASVYTSPGPDHKQADRLSVLYHVHMTSPFCSIAVLQAASRTALSSFAQCGIIMQRAGLSPILTPHCSRPRVTLPVRTILYCTVLYCTHTLCNSELDLVQAEATSVFDTAPFPPHPTRKHTSPRSWEDLPRTRDSVLRLRPRYLFL